ncbi:RNA polymerase sigma factor [Gilvimarinus chinensis]|uniref:RNA polymerase sigma factor n=1 Tax=Gilvimarinus chinensis TaxID=396005 RepID=UPI000372373E|nr:RNA polymerase sigma factor [Gilvimarinus chinensis]
MMLYCSANNPAQAINSGLPTVSAKKGAPLVASPCNNLPEAELISAAITGNEKAYLTLIETHYSTMLAVAGGIVGPTHAEDVVQEAWISAHRALPKFEQRSSLKTWLLRIVSNEALSRVKKESRHISLPESDPNGQLDENDFKANGHWASAPPRWHLDTPDALLEQDQLHRCINKTLSLLPPTQKAVFVLRDLESEPFEQVCTLLDISHSNARVLIHRARLTLMQVINRYQETGQC